MVVVAKRVKRVVLKERRVADLLLGRHVEHDPRSKSWGLNIAKELPIKSVSHRLFGNPLKQNISSCTGNATCGALNTRGLHRPGGKIFTENDAIKVYSLATALDGFPGTYPPDDTGSSGLAVAKAAQQLALIVEYRHAFSIDESMQALMERAVISGTNWYSGMDTPSSSGLVSVTGKIRGGHEWAVIGFNAKLKAVIGLNSWGKEWGINGRFFLMLEDWKRLLSEEGDCTILVN